MTANLRFTKNHNNKLNLDVFTTIRKYSEEKLKYWESFFKKEINVWVKGRTSLPYCVGILERVSVRQYYTLTNELLILDTGLTDLVKIDQLFKNFKTITSGEDNVILLTVKVSKQTEIKFPKKGL